MKARVITVSREYGSGGREIGRLLAEKLGYAYYDREIIKLAASHSGLSPKIIEEKEQNVPNSFWFNLNRGAQIANGSGYILDDEVFKAQLHVIREIADQSPCVIVGRCADAILDDRTDVLNLFLYDNPVSCAARVCERDHCDEATAYREIERINKHRAKHYDLYTTRKWGERKNYQLMIETSLLGIEGTAEWLANLIKQ